jgi:hypothetical protein
MIKRYSRLINLWRSRRQNLDKLASLETLDETLEWSARGRILGFNTSALRFRILYSLVQLFRATEFIETGTYHGATAICARNAFRVPVRSCEASLANYSVAKLVTCGLSGVRIAHAQSQEWLATEVERQGRLKNARPCFYLDAHPEGDAASWPVRAELTAILKLDSFLLAIDDFAVPEKQPAGQYRWAGPLNPIMIQSGLLAGGIREIYFPSYPPDFETGYGRSGFAIAFRSVELSSALGLRRFPLTLLEGYPLKEEL